MNEPTRQQRMAAIEHVVSEYTGLLSAGHYAVFGAAPWRAHAEITFRLHYRNMDDFLIGKNTGDRVVAAHYLPEGLVGGWDLPTWRSEWREPAREYLDHLGYFRLEAPAWTPHKWVPRLETEAREAWRLFYEALVDEEYRREFVRQVEVQRRELVPFHVRVEMLYV
jgi:hypothetical protein